MADKPFDIVFAGGGTTACVIAGRLAQANPDLKILIVERGPHTNRGDADIAFRQPARYFYNMARSINFQWIVGQPSEALNGAPPIGGAGICLGGGSGVNFMMYSRAAASDYDDWEALGNPGWGSKELIALAVKAETWEGDPSDAPNHGTSGPVKVSQGGFFSNVGQELLAVAKAYDTKRKVAVDTSDFTSSNAYGRWNMYIDKKTGHRCDTAHAYIYGRSLDNLTILTEHTVVKVITDGTRATGLQVLASGEGRMFNVYASKLVVVSAGAFQSPCILERSGIGSTEVLEKHNIPQVANLPGVGANYGDHVFMSLPCLGSDDVDWFNPIFLDEPEAIEPHVRQWREEAKGMLVTNGMDAGIRIRPLLEDLPALGPDFKSFWDNVLAPAPDKPLVQICLFPGCLHSGAKMEPGSKYYSITCMTDFSFPRGRVHIGSATDPLAPFEWHAGYLEDPADMAAMKWTYKKMFEFARRMRFYRGAVKSSSPSYKEGSQAAAAIAAKEPATGDAPDLVYDAEDDKVLDLFIRASVRSSWHSHGTCSMKPLDQGGVVDPKLNVYGIQNLKVADLSIAPKNVTANTYNTALIIGEKAAVIIAAELGLQV